MSPFVSFVSWVYVGLGLISPRRRAEKKKRKGDRKRDSLFFLSLSSGIKARKAFYMRRCVSCMLHAVFVVVFVGGEVSIVCYYAQVLQ